MTSSESSILLVGESGVGKTHYGAQLLQRLMSGGGRLKMNGAASNLDPFEVALERLNEGMAAAHTATSTYVDSLWPIVDAEGRKATMVWPDYGGEQVHSMIESRRLSAGWQERVRSSSAWLLMLRLQKTRAVDDIFSKPLRELRSTATSSQELQISDQARMVELLQMLIFAGSLGDRPFDTPRLGVLLTCWDELGAKGTPEEVLCQRMPMLSTFIRSNWSSPVILGLSALERSLSPQERDMEYVTKGPEEFGFVITEDGSRDSDLTLPIDILLSGSIREQA